MTSTNTITKTGAAIIIQRPGEVISGPDQVLVLRDIGSEARDAVETGRAPAAIIPARAAFLEIAALALPASAVADQAAIAVGNVPSAAIAQIEACRPQVAASILTFGLKDWAALADILTTAEVAAARL
jgi:hypothetical protein